jgi:hypothetical protein
LREVIAAAELLQDEYQVAADKYIRAFDCSTIQQNSQIAHHPRERWGLFVTIAPACPSAVIKANACVLGGRQLDPGPAIHVVAQTRLDNHRGPAFSFAAQVQVKASDINKFTGRQMRLGRAHPACVVGLASDGACSKQNEDYEAR